MKKTLFADMVANAKGYFVEMWFDNSPISGEPKYCGSIKESDHQEVSFRAGDDTMRHVDWAIDGLPMNSEKIDVVSDCNILQEAGKQAREQSDGHFLGIIVVLKGRYHAINLLESH